ncbi:MAG: MATE family efflux transporter [Pseudomonadales bacterium]|jgi:MATE family multidrug resistance protein|nr:MATE family efflux transporter [Pseudomonadales bacterium]MDA0761863.1 MATE family efflux transporter [Pseudomonadota bacterium]MDA0958868.1 MATE family efflux transporter [Pseudomonadota bacterium]
MNTARALTKTKAPPYEAVLSYEQNSAKGAKATQSMKIIGLEIKKLFQLALPLMGAQLAQMGMGVTDTIMAGQYSAVDLAGVALGSSVLWPVMLLFMGCIQAVTPTVSQLNGAKEFTEIGEVIRQGLWMAIVGGLAAALLLNLIGPIYDLLQVEASSARISIAYLQMCSLGIPALMCFFALRFLADGMGFTRPALLIAISALILKIPLNYVLIYGVFGFPELGGIGCGVAQAIIMWFQLILVVFVVTRPRFKKTQWLRRITAPDWPRIKQLLIVGLPIGATIFAEMGLFAFTTLLLGRYGPEVVAAHNISMNINAVLFMPPMALGMAATIRIGFRIGEGEALAARSTAGIAIAGSMLLAVTGAVLIFSLREVLIGFYTEEPGVINLARELLLFVVFFLIFDATQSTAIGTLRGYKDTQIPMRVALLSYWVIGLPLGCALGFGWFMPALQVYGFWYGLAAGVGTASILLCYRLWTLSGNLTLITALSNQGTVKPS